MLPQVLGLLYCTISALVVALAVLLVAMRCLQLTECLGLVATLPQPGSTASTSAEPALQSLQVPWTLQVVLSLQQHFCGCVVFV